MAAKETLSLAEHTGVVDYVPGDLTITLRAGTTLAELERIVAGTGWRMTKLLKQDAPTYVAILERA